MKDETQAILYVLAAGALFFFASKVLSRPRAPGLKNPSRIACLGDSLTAAGMYCADLAETLGCTSKAFGYASQGVGVVGGHVGEVIAWQPDAVVVLAGVNDLPRDGGADKAIAGLTKIYAALKEQKIAVVAVEIAPWHEYPSAYGHEQNTFVVNEWIRKTANVDAVVRTASLGDSQYRLLKKYDSGDGLHLNREGQAALADLIARQGFGR